MKRLAIMLACCYTTACSAAATPEQDLAGKYVAKYPYGREELQLNKDHSYRQQFELIGGGGPASHRGSWHYEPKSSRLVLDAPLIVDDGFGKLNPSYKAPSNGSWLLDVRGSRGKVTLNWNDDLGVRFEKTQ